MKKAKEKDKVVATKDRLVYRKIIKKEPRATVVLSGEVPRSKYFNKTYEAEKRNLLSWK